MSDSLIASLDNFTRHYLIAALWASGEEFDQFSIDDFTSEAIASATADCTKFQQDNAALLAEAYKLYAPHPDAPTPECSAGHDFWLTRNRQGAGFWDRGLGQIGDDLTAMAHTYKETFLYVGDDGKLYFE